MTSRTPYYICPKKVINRAKFDVCTAGSFAGVTTDRHTNGIAICIVDAKMQAIKQNTTLEVKQ